MIRLLIFSQDAKLQLLLGPTLGSEFKVAVESREDRVKALVAAELCDVLILDLEAGLHERQLAFLKEIRNPRVPVVAMANDDCWSTVPELVERGVYDQFRKPPFLPELKATVRKAHEHGILRRKFEDGELCRVASTCDKLIGNSARSQAVYGLIRRVAGLNVSVLITGESGTGKELIARAIHNLRNRQKSPFVAVSCGAIPETLIETELFGCEKGAFTGAVGRRQGYLEHAGDGTLFLDEIGELSLNTQVKLLRVLQERTFSRVGDHGVIPLNARVVCATHRNLEQMVAEGSFRQDLYYRVNVMCIRAPALRDRTEDIPLLAHHFLRTYSEAFQKSVTSIAPDAMTRLTAYHWPGNVRELENVIQGAIIAADSDHIAPENLPEAFQCPDLSCVGDFPSEPSFEEQLRDYKIKLARGAIEKCNGNKTLAARSLNISRAYLHQLIREAVENGIHVA